MDDFQATILAFLVKFWQSTQPYLTKAWDFLILIFNSLRFIFQATYNFCKKYFILIAAYLISSAKLYPRLALAISFTLALGWLFARSMRKHAMENNVENKDFWVKVIKYTWILGAVYYFFTARRRFISHAERVEKFQRQIIPARKKGI